MGEMLRADIVLPLLAVAVSVYAVWHSTRIAKLQALSAYNARWFEVNKLILESGEARKAFGDMVGVDDARTDPAMRLAYIYINTCVSGYQLWKMGIMPRAQMRADMAITMRNFGDRAPEILASAERSQFPTPLLAELRRAYEDAQRQA